MIRCFNQAFSDIQGHFNMLTLLLKLGREKPDFFREIAENYRNS